MTKTSKVKLTAAEELEKLNAFHAEQVKALQPRLDDERQAALEEQRKAEEAALAVKRAEASEIAEYILTLSAKADKAAADLVKLLIERRDAGRDLSARFRDIEMVGHHFEYDRIHSHALADLDAIRQRRRGDSKHQTYVELDGRALHRLRATEKAA